MHFRHLLPALFHPCCGTNEEMADLASDKVLQPGQPHLQGFFDILISLAANMELL